MTKRVLRIYQKAYILSSVFTLPKGLKTKGLSRTKSSMLELGLTNKRFCMSSSIWIRYEGPSSNKVHPRRRRDVPSLFSASRRLTKGGVSITSSSYFTLEEFKYSAACFIPLISINLNTFQRILNIRL